MSHMQQFRTSVDRSFATCPRVWNGVHHRPCEVATGHLASSVVSGGTCDLALYGACTAKNTAVLGTW